MNEEPKSEFPPILALFPAKPDRERTFYANVIQWYTTPHEAILDFKQVAPEDYQITTSSQSPGEIEGQVQFDPAKIPVEVRVIVPKSQFDFMVDKLIEKKIALSGGVKNAKGSD